MMYFLPQFICVTNIYRTSAYVHFVQYWESKHEYNVVSEVKEDQSREVHKLIRGSNSYRVLDIIKGKCVCVCVCVCVG